MTRWAAIIIFSLASISSAGDHSSGGKRRVINLVKPSYPQMARTMHISGVVKLEATIGSDGRPRRLDVKGGHPVLIKAAVDAVFAWRWAAGPRETTEPIELTFADQKW